MSNIFDNSKVWNRALDDIMSESFGKYAKYIIQDRALPDIRDGLKPVQRRILFAMYDLNINHDKPYKKSARTVGEVIGKYHPHGDSSIYEAMVRMSQEWKNNIPLLDMQGNKGSIDGDSAAAMRYTECRLSKFGELLLTNIEKETVKFIPNFDDSENEPSVLPSLLPNILVNGATGIAAGYATNVPPFNLSEVITGTIYRINHPNCNLKEISSIIKGPDFPTGGIIQGKDGILEMFATGRGKFNIRAKIEENTRLTKGNKKQLIVTEIPYESNKASIVKAIDELRVNNELPGLKEVRDDSDKDGISIVLEFDTEKSLDILKNFLYKKTQLQISYSANIILIKDRKPYQCNLMDIIDAYIEHANDIVVKSSTFELKKALNRKEILEGLIKAINDIDNLVRLIKSSTSKEEAKNKLIDFFELTEKQAEAVVQLRLYVLTSYDTQKLIDEYKELLEFIDIKKKLINDQQYRNQHLITTFEGFNKTLGFKRRTVIEDEIEEIVVSETDIIEENHGVCVVTRDCYIKFMPDTTLTDVDVNKLKIKDGDLPIDMFDMSTLDTLVVLTNKGKCITIPSHKIKLTKIKEIGIHVNELVTIDSSEKAISAFTVNKESYINTEVLVATKQSQIKRFLIQDIAPAKNAKTTTYINLKNDDEVVSSFVVQDKYKELISITSSGYAIRFNIEEVPVVGRTAAGVKNINLKNDDIVSSVIPVEPEESFILLVSNRGGKRIHFEDIALSSRATIGKRILAQVESNPYFIHSAFMIGGRQYIMLLNDMGKLKDQKVAEIPITDNQTRMNSFPDFEGGIVKASFIKKNKNFIISDENDNFLSLEQQKNEEKLSEATYKPEKNSSALKKLLNQPIKQKEMEFESEDIKVDTSNNILEIIDDKKITTSISDDEISNEIDKNDTNFDNSNNLEENNQISNDDLKEDNNIGVTIKEKQEDLDDDTSNIEKENKESFALEQQLDNILDENEVEENKEENITIEENSEIKKSEDEEEYSQDDNSSLENNSEEISNQEDQLDNNLNEDGIENKSEKSIENNDTNDKVSDLPSNSLENKQEKHSSKKKTNPWFDKIFAFADEEDNLSKEENSDSSINEINNNSISEDTILDKLNDDNLENNDSTLEPSNNINETEISAISDDLSDVDDKNIDNLDDISEDHEEIELTKNIDDDMSEEENDKHQNVSDDLNDDENIISENPSSTTPIIDALLENDNDLALQLIHYGSDVNEIDEDGQTPLMIAANSGNVKIVSKLIEHNANLDIQDTTYEYTALMYAVQNNEYEVVKLLIDAGADLDLRTQDYVSALTIAMEQNENEDMGKLLVENGASDPNEYFEIVDEDENK
ncbi:DNA topoisomerase IV subunit A [Malacoplasma muris]|uniref:DNA topoisomerase IV subunit A n=1 Tax=Malacoplasma muris TaxID=2119 RepID=UPI00398F23ED